MACRKLFKANSENGALKVSRRRNCEDLFLISYHDLALNLASAAGLQQAVSSEAVVGGNVVDVEEDDKERRLCLFEYSIYVNILYVFPDFRSISVENFVVRGSMVQLAGLDA